MVGMMGPIPPMATAARGVVVVALAVLGYVHYVEYVDGLPPCPLCLWQRAFWLAALIVALIATIITIWCVPATGRGRSIPSLIIGRDDRARARVMMAVRGLLILAALILFAGGGVGVYHLGIEHGWWATASCATPDIRADQGIEKLRQMLLARGAVSCSEPLWTWLNLSMAGWNGLVSFLLSLGLSIVIMANTTKK